MSDFLEQFEYIRNQLTFIKSKIELDNELGLLDINKLGENIFMHTLNDVYDWNLTNANLLQENFPAIDLIDNTNKLVIQVTSTTTTDKLRSTIEKFKALSQYSGYQLKIFYIRNKPNFQKDSLSEFVQNGVSSNDMLGIENILDVIQADHNKCKALYLTLKQRIDSLAFSFNINSYFKNAEPQLVDVTSNKFKAYEAQFLEFLSSENKLFEIYASGGNGKSHLVKHLCSSKTNYISLIFTKQVNIEEDLKKLSPDKNYLLIFDDIDRFLDTNILISLLSFTLGKENCKLLITYRTASKSVISSILRKYSIVPKQELEIIWSKEDIYELIKFLNDSLKDAQIEKLSHTFNNNPYLITQALKGDIHTIKEFSKKIIDDTEAGLRDFGLNNSQISDFLFELALIAPISENDIKKYFPDHIKIIEKLEDIKVLRKLSSKYRFNPDIQGDLFLGYYIENNQKNFEKKVEDILPFFSQTVFTNLSYALAYTKNDSLIDFIKRIIVNWGRENIYRNDYLFLINKIVAYAPMESFIYLEKATKYLIPLENERPYDSALSQVMTKISLQNGDFNTKIEVINLGSIEPIISKLIDLLKNNTTVEELQIKHIINYLTSEMALSLPKPYYDNQTLTSIFKKIVSPLNTRNFEVIIEALETMQNWINETPINPKKLNLLKESIQSLVSATFDNSYSDGFTYHFGQIPLNLKHPYVLKIIDKAKDILAVMLESKNNQILYAGIDSIGSIGGREIDRITPESQKFYSDLKVVYLKKIVDLLNNHQEFFIVSKIDKLAINILNFYSEKDEALAILKAINRSDEFLLYQIVVGVDFLIVDFESFYEEYSQQDDVKKWMFDSVYKKGKYQLNNEEQTIVKRLSHKYTNIEELIGLLNELDTYNWNSYRSLLDILQLWYDENNIVIIEVCTNYLDNGVIKNEVTLNVLKELALDKRILPIVAHNITNDTSVEDLKVYISSIFKNYTHDKLVALNKIIEVIQNKDANEIRMFISIISQRLYFTINSFPELFEEFKSIILKFFDLQLQYKFNVESYLTHHIMENIKSIYGIPDDIKNKLIEIINHEDIYIEEYDLQSIYKLLELKLDELLATLFKKLTSKTSDGKYRHYFSHYFDHEKITESLLIKDYIKSYDDFKFLVEETLQYYNNFNEYIVDKEGNQKAIKIHLDYFLKYSFKQEYLERLFDELFINNDIDKIKILYTIVPVSDEYFDLIIKNLNALKDYIDDVKLMHYITQMGKIKSYSSAPLQNSNELLSEEELLQKIYDVVDDLSLKIKIKEELKYIEIQKKHEIENDIEFLLGKK